MSIYGKKGNWQIKLYLIVFLNTFPKGNAGAGKNSISIKNYDYSIIYILFILRKSRRLLWKTGAKAA